MIYYEIRRDAEFDARDARATQLLEIAAHVHASRFFQT
jgi:hypothetical protein